MDFAQWLQNELNKRNWSQSDLLRHSSEIGYKISQTQLSNILLGKRQAGPEYCIAIAEVFKLSREEVFKARGWLLAHPQDPDGPQIDPRALGLAKEISTLPIESRNVTLNAVQAVVESTRHLTLKIQELSAMPQAAG